MSDIDPDRPAAPASASTSEQNKRGKSQKLSDADFLRGQMADSKAAAAATMGEMGDKLKDLVDLQAWTRQYPWIAAALAAGAGFAVAATLVPSDAADARKKWRHMKDFFTPDASAPLNGNKSPSGRRQRGDAEPEPPKSSWLGVILREAISALRPLIMTLVSSHFVRKGQHPADENGDSVSPDPAQP